MQSLCAVWFSFTNHSKGLNFPTFKLTSIQVQPAPLHTSTSSSLPNAHRKWLTQGLKNYILNADHTLVRPTKMSLKSCCQERKSGGVGSKEPVSDAALSTPFSIQIGNGVTPFLLCYCHGQSHKTVSINQTTTASSDETTTASINETATVSINETSAMSIDEATSTVSINETTTVIQNTDGTHF